MGILFNWFWLSRSLVDCVFIRLQLKSIGWSLSSSALALLLLWWLDEPYEDIEEDEELVDDGEMMFAWADDGAFESFSERFVDALVCMIIEEDDCDEGDADGDFISA